MRNPWQILVVGGGASGMMAAIAAARSGAKVCLVEKNQRLGRSILATGNGRCNLSNTALDGSGVAAGSFYNNPDFVMPIIGQNSCELLRTRFEQFGLLTFADAAGRVYPITASAASVLDVLRNQIEALNVELLTGIEVGRISANKPGEFSITTSNDRLITAEAVVVASGHGDLLRAVAEHHFVKQTPVLGSLQTNTAPLKGLDGIRVRCKATLAPSPQNAKAKCGSKCDQKCDLECAPRFDLEPGSTELIAKNPPFSTTGELLFRKYGISGIMVFDLSRYALNGDKIILNFLPDYQPVELLSLLQKRQLELGGYSAEQFLTGMLHSRLSLAVLRSLGIESNLNSKALDLQNLANALQNFELTVTGGPSAKQAQVMRGGLDVEYFDPATLQSRQSPGLFACGEALDIDAACGGFNLHWAWTSGWQAGSAAAKLFL